MGLPDQPRQAGDVPPEWFEWRGGVDVKLSRIPVIETKVDKNSDTLSKMPDEIEKRMKNVINGCGVTLPPGNGQPITFKWFTEKLLLPIVLIVASLIIAAAFASAQ
jgi:hypothetical protein